MAKTEVEDELLVALRHPLRREILKTMAGQEKISPREVADKLREPLPNVGYHVRVLRECDCIELVEQVPVRGSIQHFYRVDIDEPWALAALGLSA
jgi:DNA-binding transcriptional ArsR family regulator